METRPERVTASVFVACFALMVLGVSACGGSESHAASPSRSTPDVPDATPEAPNSKQVEQEPEPHPAEACADGTCTACGPGICPTGWYCDESAAGGPACGWLPECVRSRSCACLRSKFPGTCQCSEEDGGLHVTCR